MEPRRGLRRGGASRTTNLASCSPTASASAFDPSTTSINILASRYVTFIN